MVSLKLRDAIPGPPARKVVRGDAVHRKCGLTPSGGPGTAPSVDFPSRPQRQLRLTMHRIACAPLLNGRNGKSISALQTNNERL